MSKNLKLHTVLFLILYSFNIFAQSKNDDQTWFGSFYSKISGLFDSDELAKPSNNLNGTWKTRVLGNEDGEEWQLLSLKSGTIRSPQKDIQTIELEKTHPNLKTVFLHLKSLFPDYSVERENKVIGFWNGFKATELRYKIARFDQLERLQEKYPDEDYWDEISVKQIELQDADNKVQILSSVLLFIDFKSSPESKIETLDGHSVLSSINFYGGMGQIRIEDYFSWDYELKKPILLKYYSKVEDYISKVTETPFEIRSAGLNLDLQKEILTAELFNYEDSNVKGTNGLVKIFYRLTLRNPKVYKISYFKDTIRLPQKELYLLNQNGGSNSDSSHSIFENEILVGDYSKVQKEKITTVNLPNLHSEWLEALKLASYSLENFTPSSKEILKTKDFSLSQKLYSISSTDKSLLGKKIRDNYSLIQFWLKQNDSSKLLASFAIDKEKGIKNVSLLGSKQENNTLFLFFEYIDPSTNSVTKSLKINLEDS